MNTVLCKLKSVSRLIMLPHSLFSLPYGAAAAFLASGGRLTHQFLPLSVALVAARSAANAFNRIADRRIDRINPRTADRQLMTGEVSVREAAVVTAASLVTAAVCAYIISPVCAALFPFAAGICIFYSYTKRFTYLCHLILGVACSFSPLGAYFAVSSRFTADALILAGAAGYQVAAFDILYAVCDIDFDRAFGLFSFPARFGARHAVQTAGLLQFKSLEFLALLSIRSNYTVLPAVIPAAALICLASRRHVKLKKPYSTVYRYNAACTVICSAGIVADLILLG